MIQYPGPGESVSGNPTAATLSSFGLMDEILGQKPSTRPPVVIASLHEDQDEVQQCVTQWRMKISRSNRQESDREDEVLNLIRGHEVAGGSGGEDSTGNKREDGQTLWIQI